MKTLYIFLIILFAFNSEVFAQSNNKNQTGTDTAHFHHVRLNVTNIAETQKWYERVFGALPVNFNNKTPGLFTERSFILMNKVEKPAFTNLKTSLWHIGWGGVDGVNEYAWWKNQGVEFYQPLTELGTNHYMYLYGPDREIIEIYTGGKHHNFNHVHILASDYKKTTQWFKQALNLPDSAVRDIRVGFIVYIDNVQIIIIPNADPYIPKEQEETFLPTDDSSIAHIAFSYRDLQSAYQRIKKDGFEIVSEISASKLHGLPSFFARATDGILVEFVEAKPIPEGIWE